MILTKGGSLVLFFLLPLSGIFPTAGGGSPNVHTVVIREMKFVPAGIRVQAGDTIVWINQDMVAHNVTEEKSKAWASPVIPPGQSWKTAISQSGSYFCSLHPVMKGKIQAQ